MLKRWRTELIALVVGVAIGVGIGVIAGVGPFGTSESDRASDGAAAYLKAFADNDASELCASISPLARTRLQFSGQSCLQSAATALNKLPQAQRAALADAKITGVSLNGTRGTAHFEPTLSGRDAMDLVKVGDQWLVND